MQQEIRFCWFCLELIVLTIEYKRMSVYKRKQRRWQHDNYRLITTFLLFIFWTVTQQAEEYLTLKKNCQPQCPDSSKNMYSCNSGKNYYNEKLLWLVKKLKIFVISSYLTSIHGNAVPLRQLRNNSC
jgi:hypothetical protein